MAASSDENTTPKLKLNDQELAPEEAPAPAATAGRRRQKVPLAPGHTLAHWNALVQQRKHSVPAVQITPKMLASHNTQTDAWTSINGKVFDLTRYMDYHPGGTKEKLSKSFKRGATTDLVNVQVLRSFC
jgi:cytochrome b involved in lipid metabolism